MNLAKKFKSYFVRGLAVILPTILTVWLFVWLYQFIQQNISVYINYVIAWLFVELSGQDWGNEAVRDVWIKFWVQGWGSVAGLVIAIVFVWIVGALLASFFGKSIWRMAERLIMRAPLINRVYPYLKQVTDFLIEEPGSKKLFSKVVAIEYPRKGLLALGMVTGEGLKQLKDRTGKELINVLIATSPTPFTGFVAIVPKDEVIELNITIEEAFRFFMSAGVITPDTILDAQKMQSASENL